MMNFKQEEVLQSIIAKLQEKFPEVQLVSVEELGADSFWVTLIEPSDEDRQIELEALQGELVTDALMDYGFVFQLVPASMEKAGVK